MDIFIAGATGVVGRRAVPALIEGGHRITAAGRDREKLEALERLGARTVALDLFDPDAVHRAVAGHQVVINLATSIPTLARTFLRRAWRLNDRVRREASANLVEAALAGGAQRYVQESFAPTYPDCGDEWIDERTPIQPVAYNRTVLDAEASAGRFCQAGRVGVVLRFASFYGPDSDFIQAMFQLTRHGWLPVFGAPGGFFSSVAHDDAATAVVAALDLPAGAYNVSDDLPLRRCEVAGAFGAALGMAAPRLPPRWMGKLGGSVGEALARSQRICNHKLKAASNWRPKYPSLREGLPAALEKAREN
jgi:nucleoside-diphosphate-sugar epimerase